MLFKDMEEIYGEKRPVAKETNYYETQRNKREEQFAPSYSADYPKQNYQRQNQRDNTFQGLLETFEKFLWRLFFKVTMTYFQCYVLKQGNSL